MTLPDKYVNDLILVVPQMRYPTRGFTLIELVMVVVVISILTATVMFNFNTQRQHAVVVQADEFRRAVSHAQLIAISQGVRLQLTTTATGYSVRICSDTQCNTATGPMTDPVTGGPFTADFSGDNITLSVGAVDFDSLGRPQSSGALRTTPSTFTFTSGDNSESVSILPITGFAQPS